MALFDTVRTASFATVLAFALIVLGISGYWVSLLGGYGTFVNFSLAVAVLTWAFVFPILLVSKLRRGSFLSWVAVELGVVGFMWIMWLATASYITSMTAGYALNCDSRFLSTVEESICRQYQALQAFSWLNWLIIFAYLVMLIVFIVKAVSTGRSVWTAEIADLSSFSAEGGAPSTNPNTMYPPSMANTNNTGYPTMASQPQPHPQQYQQAPYGQGAAQV